MNTGAVSYYFPEDSADLKVSVLEVGCSQADDLAAELAMFHQVKAAEIHHTESYLFINSCADQHVFAGLTGDAPFVDPIIHQAALNQPLLAEKFSELQFDWLITATLKPGTSDARGQTALQQAGLKLDLGEDSLVRGFYAESYYLKGDLSPDQLDLIAAYIFNPELYSSSIFTAEQIFEGSARKDLPLVKLDGQAQLISLIPVAEFSDQQLLALNTKHKLAANLAELKFFQSQYQNPEFQAYRIAQGLPGDQATDVELETWFGLRSEHCFHKEFNADLQITFDGEQGCARDHVLSLGLAKGWLSKTETGVAAHSGMFKTFIAEPAYALAEKIAERGNNWISSMFSDNSGVVHYDQNYLYCLKVETHNSPSNIEPVQGAKTGLNGNFRDIMGTMRGSFDIIMGFFTYCTGFTDQKNLAQKLPAGVKHPYKLLRGMTRGVREAGNEMQIPTMHGLVFQDPRYIAKCLVFAGAVGWSPVKKLLSGQGGGSAVGPQEVDYRLKEPRAGDLVFVAGQPVGIDGIHGATESSLSASENISLGHVQADYSFIQVKVKDFIQDASRRGLFTSVTDFGAMGLGSASHEMARATDGLQMDLAKHPTKYDGILPWQINASETQDRMLLVADPVNKPEILKLAELYDVEATELGALKSDGYINLTYGEQPAACFKIEQLFSKEPIKKMTAPYAAFPQVSAGKQTESPAVSEISNLQEAAQLVLADPNVAGKGWFFRQKDFSVKGATVIGPLIGTSLSVDADATLQKPLETVGYDFGAIACAQSAAPLFDDLDPYLAVQKSYLDLLGKILALGVSLPDLKKKSWDAWAACGNYCQPNSDPETTLNPESGARNLNSLLRQGIAIRELVECFNVPIISGKDSMKCSCIYKLPEDFNPETDLNPDLLPYVNFKVDHQDQKFLEIHNPATYLASAAVRVQDYRLLQTAGFKAEQQVVCLFGMPASSLAASSFARTQAAQDDFTAPSFDLDQFSLQAACLAEIFGEQLLSSSAYIHAGGLFTALYKAVEINKVAATITLDALPKNLFCEEPGRFLFSCRSENLERLEELCKKNGVTLQQIGETVPGSPGLIINGDTLDFPALREAYQGTFNFSEYSAYED